VIVIEGGTVLTSTTPIACTRRITWVLDGDRITAVGLDRIGGSGA
jgi:hypothetical protein